jgi:uncharacterized protein (DUF1800 family)
MIVEIKLDTSTDPQVGYRPPGSLDAASALAPYTGRFGPRQAAHLLRRAGFGGSAADVARLSALDAHRAVDTLVHPSAPDGTFAAYPDTDALYDKNFGKAKAAVQQWWLDRMLLTQNPLVEKMTFFWHGHFATSINKVPPPLMARQINLFRDQGMGNFHTLLASVSVDPAMSVWLDNRFNTKAHANENYAREIMELFSLGLGNYTEDDVKAAARAFTGWPYNGKTMTVDFVPRLHDDGEKTFLGHTGTFGLLDAVNIIVMQPAHQRFIARKLLEYFVYSDPEPALIEGLAQTYALSGADIGKCVATILRSNVFYSSRAYRAVPKSPVEYVMGMLRYAGATHVPATVPYALARMGQDLLAPPSVKGWDGGPTWINTNTLLARFNFTNALVATAVPIKPRAIATAMMATPKSAAAPALWAPNIQPDAIAAEAGGLDAKRVIATIVHDALQDDVTSVVRGTLTDYLTASSEVASVPFGPENYQEKIRGAVALIFNLPVNQLN